MNSTARTVLIVVVILLLLGALPTWGYIGSPYPAGGLGLVLMVVVILILLGKI
jgi:hypothetical protein